jgi:hypothetical protein
VRRAKVVIEIWDDDFGKDEYLCGVRRNLVLWRLQNPPCFVAATKTALFCGGYKIRLVLWRLQNPPCFVAATKTALFCGGYKIRLQFHQQISYYLATENTDYFLSLLCVHQLYICNATILFTEMYKITGNVNFFTGFLDFFRAWSSSKSYFTLFCNGICKS